MFENIGEICTSLLPGWIRLLLISNLMLWKQGITYPNFLLCNTVPLLVDIWWLPLIHILSHCLFYIEDMLVCHLSVLVLSYLSLKYSCPCVFFSHHCYIVFFFFFGNKNVITYKYKQAFHAYAYTPHCSILCCLLIHCGTSASSSNVGFAQPSHCVFYNMCAKYVQKSFFSV